MTWRTSVNGEALPRDTPKETWKGVLKTLPAHSDKAIPMLLELLLQNVFLLPASANGYHTKHIHLFQMEAVQEEISQGAGRIAGFLGLNNLIMFYDSNDIQLSTETSAVTNEDTQKKYEAWGWKVMTINGNDQDEIRMALIKANEEKEKPVLIIGKTIMGKGALTTDGASFERTIIHTRTTHYRCRRML
jgi:hypothetical protein